MPWLTQESALVPMVMQNEDGTPFLGDPRNVLEHVLERYKARGWTVIAATELEFNLVDASGETIRPPKNPVTGRVLDQQSVLSVAELDAFDAFFTDLYEGAEAMGIPAQAAICEAGLGQFEINLNHQDALTAADDAWLFKTLVRGLARKHGFAASFMAKPRLENISANGWHVHQSIQDMTGANLFVPGDDGAISATASGWIAGLLDHAAESSLLLAPTINGYKRYQPFQLAPNRIAWGEDNRGAMLRALMAPGDGASRVENRAPDSTANPYYAFAAQLISGLAGLEAGKSAPPPTTSPYDPGAAPLPTTLAEAIAAFEGSALYRRVLGDGFVDYLVHIKRAEWARYLGTVSEWEQAEYFNLY